METFKQILRGPVWDGDLVSKTERDRLKEAGFIDSGYGFSFIAPKGVEAAVALGLLQRGAAHLSSYDVMKKALDDGTLKVGVDVAKPGSDRTVETMTRSPVSGAPLPPVFGHAMRDKPEMRKVDDSIIDKLDANLGF